MGVNRIMQEGTLRIIVIVLWKGMVSTGNPQDVVWCNHPGTIPYRLGPELRWEPTGDLVARLGLTSLPFRDTFYTLSTQIHQAWDSGDLRTMTKNTPAVATAAHISILEHITKDDLLRYLADIETGNGFANRCLWCCTKRAQILPEGGCDPDFSRFQPHFRSPEIEWESHEW